MSMQRIFVKPAPGVIVRNPEFGFQPLAADGAWVAPSAYWQTQLRDGAVERAEPLPKPQPVVE